jgi:hypothetical protein
MINVKFVGEDNDPAAPRRDWLEFTAGCKHVPRIGETVVRHTETGRSFDNRFTVVDVVTVVETRDWYLSSGFTESIVVVLKRKVQS